MHDSPQQPRPLSEIGHLFLSSVRQRHTGGAPRPVRIAPQHRSEPATPPEVPEEPPMHEDQLTPEELARVAPGAANEGEAAGVPPFTALIVQHMAGQEHRRAVEYARHLAAEGEQIGLIVLDTDQLLLMRFERSIQPNSGDAAPAEICEHLDHRMLSETLAEMNWDLDRWLLVLPSLRSPEVRELLKQVDHWALLSTCDHDGVVSCYRTLKGLANLHHPRMALALLDAATETQADRVYRKLSNVSLEFLGIEMQRETPVRPTRAVAETVVAHCRFTHDKAQLAAGAQYQLVSELLTQSRANARRPAPAPIPPVMPVETTDATSAVASEAREARVPAIEPEDAEPVAAEHVQPTLSLTQPAPSPAMGGHCWPGESSDAMDEVIDLAGDASGEQAVLAAVLRRYQSTSSMVECPVTPPMCPQARIGIARDRGLVLLAVAQKGLKELRAITLAHRWLVENRALLAMALPQMAMDTSSAPTLLLLVDHADAMAEALAPLLAGNHVRVQAYRKLRWSGRTGLLLEAA